MIRSDAGLFSGGNWKFNCKGCGAEGVHTTLIDASYWCKNCDPDGSKYAADKAESAKVMESFFGNLEKGGVKPDKYGRYALSEKEMLDPKLGTKNWKRGSKK